MAKETLTGKIIRIVDSKTIIINLGTSDGITDNSYFNLIGEPEEIIDPFSNEKLGSVNIVKAKLKTSQAYEKFTIATTNWSTTRFKVPGVVFPGMRDLFDTEVIDEGDLRVNKSEMEPWKAKSESPVKVGDIVTVEVEEDKGDQTGKTNVKELK